jgi:hypothetical protein
MSLFPVSFLLFFQAFSFVLRDALEAPGNSRTSEYSTACAVYFSRRSVAVRAPIGPSLNHEPATSISMAKSTCSWPGYCLTTSTYLSIALDIVVKPAGSPAPPLSRRCASPVPPARPPAVAAPSPPLRFHRPKSFLSFVPPKIFCPTQKFLMSQVPHTVALARGRTSKLREDRPGEGQREREREAQGRRGSRAHGTTHDARTEHSVPNKSVALSAECPLSRVH